MIVATLFVLLLVVGMPIALVIGLSGLVALYLTGGNRLLLMVPDRMFSGLDSFPFLAMPLFILAGEVMNRAGITLRLVEFARSLVGWLRGGLAHTNVVASVFFAGMSGSGTADAAAFGNTVVPAMVRAGYSRAYACAVTAASSIIGPTIPPSSIAILYGSLMGVSITGLFVAAIVPGVLFCVACMAVIALTARREGIPKGDVALSMRNIFETGRKSLLALLLPVIALGSMLSGFATVTEAASLAVAYALVLGFVVYRTLSPAQLVQILVRSALLTGVVFLIIATAAILAWWLAFNQIPQTLAMTVLSLTEHPALIVLLVMLLLFAVGMVMDVSASLIILVPLIAPILVGAGMDPLHAGIVIIISLNMGLVTPPVGACLFVLSSVTGEKIEAISAKIWPYLLAELAAIFLVAYWPGLVMALPRLFGFS